MVKAILLATLIGLTLGEIAMAQSQESPQNAPQISHQQQPDRSAESSTQTKQDARLAEPASIAVPQIKSDSEKKESAQDAQKNSDEASEFWTVFGRRLKFTDSLLVVFTFGLFLATLALWWSTKKLVTGAEETAERQLRAYLTPQSFQVFSHQHPEGRIWWSIHPIWRNGGQSPARAVIFNRNYSIKEGPLPKNFNFPDDPGESIKTIVGPNSTIQMAEIPVDGLDLVEIRERRKNLYIWGWVRYRDIFPDSPERITKFGTFVSGVRGNPLQAFSTDNIVEILISNQPQNNCMDDECN